VNRALSLALVVGLAIATVGCGDDGGSPSGDSGPGDGSTDGSVDSGSTDGSVDSAAGDSAAGDSAAGDSSTGDGGTGAVCGDRAITAPEECDDGNTTNGDGCDAMCRIETSATCGDSNVDRTSGEQCDDGNTTSGDGCDARCQVEAPAMCGDGSWDLAAGEECDDGNVLPGDGCSPACQLEAVGAFCGDSMMDPGEICDDGNTTNGDGCSPTCNSTTTTEVFAGMAGMAGAADGIGAVARFGGVVVLNSDANYLWIGDEANNTVRRADISTGEVVTIAGDGTNAYRDDNGLAAQFPAILGIASNGTDTVYIATAGNGGPRVRAMAMALPNAVTTLTGGTQCTSGGCYADGDPSTVTFAGLRGLTWFGGYLWVVDPAAAVLRRVDPATGNVLTVAGQPFTTGLTDGVGAAARFISPRYVISDNSGMLYISDTNGATVRAFNTVTSEVTTFAGNGTPAYVDGVGAAVRVHRPRGITTDGTSIYWAEFEAHTVRQGVLASGDVSTLVGMPMVSGYVEDVGSAARLTAPWGLAFHHPSNSLFVSSNQMIRRIR